MGLIFLQGTEVHGIFQHSQARIQLRIHTGYQNQRNLLQYQLHGVPFCQGKRKSLLNGGYASLKVR